MDYYTVKYKTTVITWHYVDNYQKRFYISIAHFYTLHIKTDLNNFLANVVCLHYNLIVLYNNNNPILLSFNFSLTLFLSYFFVLSFLSLIPAAFSFLLFVLLGVWYADDVVLSESSLRRGVETGVESWEWTFELRKTDQRNNKTTQARFALRQRTRTTGAMREYMPWTVVTWLMNRLSRSK